MSKAAELAALIGSQTALSNRRININGNFFIWQRGTSAITVSGDDDFTCDRFKGWANGGGTFTVEQSTDVPSNEFEFSAKLINTAVDSSVAAGDDYRWATDIEGYDVARLAYGSSDAKTATLSFWVKSSLTGTYCGAFYSTTASRHYIYEYTISSANTWEKKTITVEGDTTGSWNRTNGNGLRIYWGFGSGSDVQGTADVWAAGEKWETTNQAAWIGSASATFYITGVQLEAGETATPFEHESYHITAQKCYRYYYRIIENDGTVTYFGTGYHKNTTQSRIVCDLPVPMRTQPTAVEQTGTAGDYATFEGGTQVTCTVVPTYSGYGTELRQIVQFTSSGLVTGGAGDGRTANVSDGTVYLAWSAEL
jgi:hypothetical protein